MPQRDGRDRKKTCSMMETLEGRALMAATPTQILTCNTDNRGQAVFTFTNTLDATTISKRVAVIYTAGTDGILGTADDHRVGNSVSYKRGKLTLSSNLPANTQYRVILNSHVIKDINGLNLDGENKGPGNRSGNGVAGGVFDVLAKTPKKTTYQYSVTYAAGKTGYINVGLLTKAAPKSTANFISYADAGVWDTTFFHRSTLDTGSGIQVIQGGGFNVTAGSIGSVLTHTAVPLELGTSNTKGTLAMARTTDINSGTNQWFFNVNENTNLDTVGGGYAVFGLVSDPTSQAVVEAINKLTIRQGDPSNSNSPFNELPSLDATGTIDVPADLVMVSRVAKLMDQSVNTLG